ncbi:hypothetical protein PR048_002317 [Dryococelus australis]|uniref:DDE Tnp4 domain-containing protein n=1 Tax=Dryococelus australis TaxID=614101 RepID=A0ABQ9IJV2_9NEOP|nr:hypothetical protein PR048_002317 [Dryococelus australis]
MGIEGTVCRSVLQRCSRCIAVLNVMATNMEVYSRRKRVVCAYVSHPLVSSRLLKGAFATMFIDLREDESKFCYYFRMSIKSFDELATKLNVSIRNKDTVMRLTIPPLEMLVVALRYLGCSCTLLDLHYQYRIGHTTLCKIVRALCKAVLDTMRKECIPNFTVERWVENSKVFEKHANFPNCLGALDGKHVRIFFNYKHFNYVARLVVVDANCLFNYIAVGSHGREQDSTILENSKLYGLLENGQANIPHGKPLPDTTEPSRPYTGTIVFYKKRIFNYRLCNTRRYMKCTNKWRIFHRPINVKLDFALSMINCCCILHNYVRSRDGGNFEDTLSVIGLCDQDNTHPSTQGGSALKRRRNVFANYFISGDNCI